MFILELLKYILLIFTFGGFALLGYKIWQWLDDYYVNNKIGQFLSKQEYVFLRLYPPRENLKSIGEMESFFIQMMSIVKVVKPGPKYLFGFWHEEIIFEFHSDEGRVGIFVRLNRKVLPVFETALASTYPTATFNEVDDPMMDWPQEWSEDHYYDNYYGNEIKLNNDEIHPIKSWKEYQSPSNPLLITQDPINQLFNALETVQKGGYAVFQVLLRPQILMFMGSKKNDLEEQLSILRKELSENAAVEVGEDGTISALTQTEKDTIDAAQKKVNSDIYDVKIRFATFGKDVKGKDVFDPIKAYLAQYKTADQMLFKDFASDTEPGDAGEDFGYIGPWVSIAKQNIFLNRESKVRQTEYYRALLGRSFGSGIATSIMNSEELASLIHFPVTVEGSEDMSARISTDYGEGSASTVSATPPANLPG